MYEIEWREARQDLFLGAGESKISRVAKEVHTFLWVRGLPRAARCLSTLAVAFLGGAASLRVHGLQSALRGGQESLVYN